MLLMVYLSRTHFNCFQQFSRELRRKYLKKILMLTVCVSGVFHKLRRGSPRRHDGMCYGENRSNGGFACIGLIFRVVDSAVWSVAATRLDLRAAGDSVGIILFILSQHLHQSCWRGTEFAGGSSLLPSKASTPQCFRFRS